MGDDRQLVRFTSSYRTKNGRSISGVHIGQAHIAWFAQAVKDHGRLGRVLGTNKLEVNDMIGEVKRRCQSYHAPV